MSVVVRPTYSDCEEDHSAYHMHGIDVDADPKSSKGGWYASMMSPSLIMATLKKRSPGDSQNIHTAALKTGRLTSFDSSSSSSSSSSLHSSASSSSIRRSVSEPDLRHGAGGNSSEVNDDDDVDIKGREAQNNITGISNGAVGSASDDVATSRDLRADYVAIHASIDHTVSPPTNKMIVVVPSIDLDGDELKRVSTFIENYEERQLYHLLLLNDPGVRVVYTSSHPVSEDVVRYYVGLRGDGDGVSISDQMSRLYMLSPNDDSKRPLSKKLLARPLVLRLIKRLMESMEEGSLVHSNYINRPSGTDNSAAAFQPTAGLSVYTGSNACDNLAHALGLRLLESCGETMHYGTKQGR